MLETVNDKSGLYSLAGFAFQIRVFFFYALQLENNNSFVEFETLDDVTIKNRKDLETKDTHETYEVN